MNAVTFDRFGSKEVLKASLLADPLPAANQARIRVEACGVNNVDLQIREGSRGLVVFPHILGAEIAGTVDMVGDSRYESWVGRRVVVFPFLSCGECSSCLRNESNLCSHGTTIGRGMQGGYAEFVVIPISNLVEIDDAISFSQAAATAVSGLAAWHALHTRSQVRSKDTVLVVAGASGVGVWAIQIAKSMGARVIATVGRNEKSSALRALGADEVVLHSNSQWPDRVRSLAPQDGADLVFDASGQATFKESLSLLRKGGTLTFCGATTGGQVSLDLLDIFRRELQLVGSTGGTRSELEALLHALAEKKVSAVIDSVFSLHEAGLAHERLETRRHFGKIILRP